MKRATPMKLNRCNRPGSKFFLFLVNGQWAIVNPFSPSLEINAGGQLKNFE